MENLTWIEQGAIGIAALAVIYSAWNLLALTWRLSNRVLAQAQLYEAQTEYYEAKKRLIEAKMERL